MKKLFFVLITLCSVSFYLLALNSQQEDNHEKYPLHEAIYAYEDYYINDTLDEFEKLIAECENINALNDEGYAPLHIAVFKGRFNVVQQLIGAGAKIGCPDRFDWTPLLHAIQHKDHTITAYLINNGADIDEPIKNGEYPIHFATRWGMSLMHFVLNYDADVNVADSAGWTPLHNAAAYKNPDMVKLLLDYGANRRLRDLKGRTPKDLTTDKECINLLENYPPEE